MVETGLPSSKAPLHETLDAQLLRYWEREAVRFESLAARASFAWIARGYARKAQRARVRADQARDNEIARGRFPASPPAEAHGPRLSGDSSS